MKRRRGAPGVPPQPYLRGGLTPRVVTGEPLAHEMRLALIPNGSTSFLLRHLIRARTATN
jgi:hypothetical protein